MCWEPFFFFFFAKCSDDCTIQVSNGMAPLNLDENPVIVPLKVDRPSFVKVYLMNEYEFCLAEP